MPIPDTDLHRVRSWAEAKTPPEFKHEMRVEVDTDATGMTIYDCRPPWRPGRNEEWTRHGIARLRWSAKCGTWTLYWADRHGNGTYTTGFRPLRGLAPTSRRSTAIRPPFSGGNRPDRHR
jgi:Protein of unknown function (DUF3024)